MLEAEIKLLVRQYSSRCVLPLLVLSLFDIWLFVAFFFNSFECIWKTLCVHCT